MIDWLRRLIRGPDHVEDLISAYLDAPNEMDLDRIEERLRAAGVDVDELRSVRQTSQLLRSTETVEAPRSYALTPETLADRVRSHYESEGRKHRWHYCIKSKTITDGEDGLLVLS